MTLPQAATPFLPLFAEASAQHGVDPQDLAAVCSRESDFGRALKPPGPGGVGDRGHGRGLMQIDDRAQAEWVSQSRWWDAATNIDKGAEILRGCIDFFEKHRNAVPALKDDVLRKRAALAAYNCGPKLVLNCIKQGLDVDHFTTGGDYSRDVLRRRDEYAQESHV